MNPAATLAAAVACAGIALLGLGWRSVRRFARARPPAAPACRPPVSILKPLHGGEPLLEEALASFCALAYPDFQIVFGLRDRADPALAVVERLRARFPAVEIAVVIDPTRHGPNGKVSNLINMLPSARHDILVLADSDVHVPPFYLDEVAARLATPGTGLVTTLYAGMPACPALPARLGAMQITQAMLPGVLMARAMGRRDALGATMALRRETLARVGGFAALADHLADDNVLGRLVRETGLDIVLARTVVMTTVPESSFAALWRHELRWARTNRALAPVEVGMSIVFYPMVWSLAALALSGGAGAAFALVGASWLARALAARGIDRALGLATRAPLWLVPFRELMCTAVLGASFLGDRVEWRGQALRADDGRDGTAEAEPYRSEEGLRLS